MKYHEISYLTAEPDLFPEPVDIVIPVTDKDQSISYVLIGDIEEEGDMVSPIIKHVRYIQTLSNIITVAIENKRLFRESLKQEALKKEVELASRMQFIPTFHWSKAIRIMPCCPTMNTLPWQPFIILILVSEGITMM